MPDDMKPRVVRVADHDWKDLSRGKTAYVHPDMIVTAPRYLLVPLGDKPTPGEVGMTTKGTKAKCWRLSIHDNGDVEARSLHPSILALTRRADPEPTIEEALETLKNLVRSVDMDHANDALDLIEARLTKETT